MMRTNREGMTPEHAPAAMQSAKQPAPPHFQPHLKPQTAHDATLTNRPDSPAPPSTPDQTRSLNGQKHPHHQGLETAQQFTSNKF